jgi:hydrogenase-4 component E
MQAWAGLFEDVAHLLDGVALALGFALLTPRLGAMFSLVRAQSAVAAVAAAWQAWSAQSAALAAMALAVLTVGAVALPWALRRQASAAPGSRDHAPPAPATMTAAAALAVLAIVVVLPAHLPGMPQRGETLALAVAVVLVALLMLGIRRAALAQLVGFWALANGVALAAVAVGSPAGAWCSVALFGFVAVGLVVRPAREGAA